MSVLDGVIAIVPSEVEFREIESLGAAERAGEFIALESSEVVALYRGHSSESSASATRVWVAEGSNYAECAEVIAYWQGSGSCRSICGQ